MAGWSVHRGRAVALPLENVDTDQLIPARFMSTPRAEGYGRFLLHDLEGAPALDGASVLIARRNFGCGSSREAAVYALVDAGVRAVVAPSFGDIFAGNAANNGLATLRAEEADVEALLTAAPGEAAVDLEAGTLRLGPLSVAVDLPEPARKKIVNGWDDIDLTRAEAPAIAAYRATRRAEAPWAWPV
ncbi:MAG: 3-isopropylmalate dehydratase small subunit [Pseudomonadota bacterium]